jgi:hypothetical protein
LLLSDHHLEGPFWGFFVAERKGPEEELCRARKRY